MPEDRDVQARELRVERLDLVARGLRRRLAPGRERRLHPVKSSAGWTTVHPGRNFTERKWKDLGGDCG
jgi:hypothetical protein